MFADDTRMEGRKQRAAVAEIVRIAVASPLLQEEDVNIKSLPVPDL